MPKEFATPLKFEQPHLLTPEVSTPQNPLSMPPWELLLMPAKNASQKVPPDPCKPFPSELPGFPVKVENQSLGFRNPFTPPSFTSEQERESPGPSEVTFQEIVKLQTKQTKLSALIAEQQKISSLPVQEPPTFSGNYFDYTIFIRAFETIIETRVTAYKERLYFLNKYTTGKANNVVKCFVTLSSSDSYKRAKNLLAQRFSDPHRVSNAYKSHLRKWPQIGEGQSMELQAFSDFLGQCEEAMQSMKFLSDLDPGDVETSQFQAILIFRSEVVPSCL